MKITADIIDKLEAPAAGQQPKFHYDDKLKGFGVRVTHTGVRAFIFDTRVNGKSVRYTIGRCNKLGIDAAKAQVKKLAGAAAEGRNVRAERKAEQVRSKTLAEVIEDYIQARNLKTSTIKDFRMAMRTAYGKFLDKPLNAINEDIIRARHAERGKVSPARANLESRYIKAVFNYAASAYKIDGQRIITSNPANIVNEDRATFRVNRRNGRIHKHQLPVWLEAVKDLDSEWSDYFLLLIGMGLRRQEALDLKWTDIDLDGGLLTVRDPKNHNPLLLPIPARTLETLKARKVRYAARPKDRQIGYVFSDRTGDRMTNPRYAIANIKQRSGIDAVNPHDLRRTFTSVADELDIGRYTIKALTNHADNGDVTAGYIVTSPEKLRAAIQQIENEIYAQA
jgi:integrase